MRVPIEILVVICLLVGMFPHFTIDGILSAASLAVLGKEMPVYELAIWHGFNLPLLMIAMAIAGGLFIYINRKYLFQFQASLPPLNAKKTFERVILSVVA